MATAFQSNAFQNNAFQIETPAPVYSGGSGFYQPSYIAAPVSDDDDELLLAWFMFMRQPHE